ncbi:MULTISPECIES: hypothetical protein [unclassified Paenibacillus]|uniref:hypothetical protein n=1 Tax=unclassified Paenibacillus TaxID=185978 RepID=UPI000899AD17|nr:MULTISPECIES: hypothetical protein [unclassified Paenibacillus]OMC71715.1 hypothetical protein BK126_06555 [Paenibacillus sp. FSL H7-0326]SDW35508.1 hypothetical protein SAMN05518848_1011132 [Paenibacillus sp. PDC88]
MKLYEVALYLHNGYRDIELVVAESKESAERIIKERYDASKAYNYYEAEEVFSVDGYKVILTKLVHDEF